MAQRQVMSHNHEPMYGWSLDPRGRPIPIAVAERGAHGYRCPICDGPMIARKGDVNQHHFAHEIITQCTPDKVAAAIAGQWLVLQLGERMVLGKNSPIYWQISKDRYSADLLKDVTAIIENLNTEHGLADIALITAQNDIRCIISLNPVPDELALERFIANGIAVIVPPIERFRSGQLTLESLLEQSRVLGGWWLVGSKSKVGKLLTDPQTLRGLLTSTVNYPPYQFWRKLETVDEQKDVLQLGEHRLWLPPEIWQTAIGGSRNRLSGDLIVTIQEWTQSDGTTVVLFYVSLREEDRAVAVRRYARGQSPQIRLQDTSYKMRKTTATDIARLLATG